MRFEHRITAFALLTGVLLMSAISGIAPGVDPEPFPRHQTLALGTAAVDPEPFPWHADDRVKVRFPRLTADGLAINCGPLVEA